MEMTGGFFLHFDSSDKKKQKFANNKLNVIIIIR
jgi:hypothetical protein